MVGKKVELDEDEILLLKNVLSKEIDRVIDEQEHAKQKYDIDISESTEKIRNRCLKIMRKIGILAGYVDLVAREMEKANIVTGKISGTTEKKEMERIKNKLGRDDKQKKKMVEEIMDRIISSGTDDENMENY